MRFWGFLLFLIFVAIIAHNSGFTALSMFLFAVGKWLAIFAFGLICLVAIISVIVMIVLLFSE